MVTSTKKIPRHQWFVQITVPLLETLVTEMRKARDRNLPYDFQHYIMISKLYKTKNLTAGLNGAPSETQVESPSNLNLFFNSIK